MDRQHTTILAPDQETGGRGFGFGQPTEMLGSNPHSASAGSSLYAHHPSSVRPLTQGSPLVKYGTATKSEASFMSEGGPLSEHEQGTQNADPPRRVTRGNKLRKLTHTSTPSRKATSTAASTKTQSDDADYRDVLRIPSSESPSPMKIAHLQRNSSISPAKLDPGAAKALHESIASLLGKRHSAEDDELPAVESVEESAAGKSGGNGGSAIKRPKRPLRAKVSYLEARSSGLLTQVSKCNFRLPHGLELKHGNLHRLPPPVCQSTRSSHSARSTPTAPHIQMRRATARSASKKTSLRVSYMRTPHSCRSANA